MYTLTKCKYLKKETCFYSAGILFSALRRKLIKSNYFKRYIIFFPSSRLSLMINATLVFRGKWSLKVSRHRAVWCLSWYSSQSCSQVASLCTVSASNAAAINSIIYRDATSHMLSSSNIFNGEQISVLNLMCTWHVRSLRPIHRKIYQNWRKREENSYSLSVHYQQELIYH